jgi:hypothetical protein
VGAVAVSKAIASLGVGPHERLLRLAARSFRPFADRHGYDLHLHTELADATRPAPWSKIPIQRELLERYETVVWLDSDLVIVDGREDLPAPEFMGLVEHVTKEGRMPNSGVWALRAGQDARRFLDEVWAQEDLTDHRWWENAAICRLLGYALDPVRPGPPTPWLERTTFLDPRWNSIPDSRARRPRIRHYPGYSTRTRGVLMARDLLLRPR